ncbi:hypothetical protein BC941DRAFT_442455 [Chlamydoabsidia padenii]|nr:hypothetical protein BC941DRAFT_442455 [Chlamydoabsidia padenii]
MLFFISIFCHIYLLTSLLEPTETLHVTVSFFHQLQQKTTNNQAHNMKGNKAGAIIQIISSVMVLLVRVFILLCVLLIISLVELYSGTTKTKNIQELETGIATTLSTMNNNNNNNNNASSASPLLLPTPPCEKEVDVLDPTKKMNDPPISYHVDAVVRPATETKVVAVPSEPASLSLYSPPDEARSKQSKDQQTITNSTNDDDDDDVGDVSCYSSEPMPSIQNSTVELNQQQDRLPDIQKTPLSSMISMQHKNSISYSLTGDKDNLVSSQSLSLSLSLSQPPPSSDEFISQASNSVTDENTQKTQSEMPDHTPNEHSSTESMSISNENKITQIEPIIEDMKSSPASVPLLSPSASLSSSLSTLNHITNQQEKSATITGSDSQHLHGLGRFHRSFIKKQQQQQQQQQSDKIDVLIPIPSHSSRTHKSNTSTAPLGNSLSTKLNKLKQPGRRISQMFKKKNKQ